MQKPNRSSCHHGRDIYYMVDEEGFRTTEGFLPFKAGFEKFFRVNTGAADDDPSKISGPSIFRFGRMFTERKEQPCDAALIMLGQAMFQDVVKESSKTTAGYTFLGQFIGHDMSFDDQRLIFPDAGLVPNFQSQQSPTFDLDSLYGKTFAENGEVKFDPKLYEEDGIRFKLGLTGMARSIPPLPNDLPREDRLANIGDERNDENLGLAQTVVCFLRFHNAVVERLVKEGRVTGDELFNTARELVIRHYQWIILEDFLPEIIDANILNEVKTWAIDSDSKLDWIKKSDSFIPVEFAVAAFRLGHSMLQSQYEWNRFFETLNDPDSGRVATFEDLFKFTGRGGLEGNEQLPGDWVIDWRRFYDFSFYGIQPSEKSNSAGIIDPILINNLKGLPEFHFPPSALTQNLAVRNLLRGKLLGLPSGQDVVRELGSKLDGKPLLTRDQLVDGPHRDILARDGLDENTPLWYYVLKEAQVHGERGERLGSVGSYIVAQTVALLMARSEVSILRDKWKPELSKPLLAPAGRFKMADLIRFSHTKEKPLIYPLGEETNTLPGE